MSLKNAFKCKLSIAGEDFGEFDSFSGGAYDSTETKYTPFDGVERVYLSFSSVGNVTVGRSYEVARDGSIVQRRESLQHQPFVLVVLERDANGVYQQNRAPYTGLTKAITPPEGDSTASDVAMLQIELSTGKVGA